MKDPLDKLARFTPSAGGLDRDELLFRAGRASVRQPRRWKVVCAVLTVSQSLTILGGYLAYPRQPGSFAAPAIIAEPAFVPEATPRPPECPTVLLSDPDRLPMPPPAESTDRPPMTVMSFSRVLAY